MGIGKLYVMVAGALIVLLSSCAPVPSTPSSAAPVATQAPVREGVLTVWHAWQEKEVEILEEIAVSYQEETGIKVELAQYETPSALLAELQAASAAGEGPDVFLGPHTWASQLLAQDIVGAYCGPDQCEECNGPNPPRWCPVATGDLGERIVDDFPMKVGLCDVDQCPVCFSEKPPLWCRFATEDFGSELDIPHATFFTPVNGDGFPFGIPIWWEYTGVFANPSWFEEQGLGLPTTLDEARSIVEEFGGVYYSGDPSPDPMLGDPDPQPNLPEQAGILVAISDRFASLQETVEGLTLLPLEDYRPPILVHGAYMNTHTQMRNQALDFIYVVADEEAQQHLFDATGHLPAHGEVLEIASEGVIGEWVQFGKTGLPMGIAEPME